jgi:excisionase family DNA binding protein
MMRITEVASRLAISRDTVRRLIERNELRAARIGHQWRIEEADLQAYLVRQANSAEQASGGLSEFGRTNMRLRGG